MTTANIFSVGKNNSNVYDALGAGSNNDIKRAEEAAEIFGYVMNQMAEEVAYMQSEGNTVSETEPISADMDSAEDHYKYSVRENPVEQAPEDNLDVPEETVVKEVEELTDEAVEMICEKLNVSKEELFHTMQELGISETDLFLPEKLGQLVMELTGETDVFALLTNPDFQSILQELNVMEKDAAASLGMSLEQFHETLQQRITTNYNVGAEEKVVEGPDTEETLNVDSAEIQETVKSSGKVEEQPVKEVTKNATEETEVQTTVNRDETEFVNTEEDVKLHDDSETQITVNQEETSEEAIPQKMEQQHGGEKNNSSENRNHHFNENAANTAAFQAEVSSNVIAEENFADISYSHIDMDDLMQQFVEKTRVAFLENRTTMDMQLNPENLGKIYLHLTAEEGVVRAQIMATNETVKEALEAQIAALRENLNQAGVKVDSVEVSVAAHEFEQNLEQHNRQEEQQGEMQEELSHTRRNLDLNSLDELAGVLSEEEVLVAQMMRDNGNSVDFTA